MKPEAGQIKAIASCDIQQSRRHSARSGRARVCVCVYVRVCVCVCVSASVSSETVGQVCGFFFEIRAFMYPKIYSTTKSSFFWAWKATGCGCIGTSFRHASNDSPLLDLRCQPSIIY